MNNNSTALLSFFPKHLSRVIKVIRQKTKDNIHHLYLYSRLPATVSKLKNTVSIYGVYG